CGAQEPQPPNGQPPPPTAMAGQANSSTVSGKVSEFTKGPDGQTNGFKLTNGTVVHLPPDLQRQTYGAVDKGIKVEAMGMARQIDGQQVVDAQSIRLNGQQYVSTAPPPPPPGGPGAGGPPPPNGRMGAPPPPPPNGSAPMPDPNAPPTPAPNPR
ncbi:MAG: hypothetical protein ABI383_06895, partial [Acidobacteriaceae bacterium]